MNASTIIVKTNISAIVFSLKTLGVTLTAEENAMVEDIASVTGGDEQVTVRVTDTEMTLNFSVKDEPEAMVRLTEFSTKDHFTVSMHDDVKFTVTKERIVETAQEEKATVKEEEKPAAKTEEKKEEVKVEVTNSWFSPKTKKVVGYGTLVCAVAAGGFFAWKKFHSTAE